MSTIHWFLRIWDCAQIAVLVGLLSAFVLLLAPLPLLLLLLLLAAVVSLLLLALLLLVWLSFMKSSVCAVVVRFVLFDVVAGVHVVVSVVGV